MVIARAPLAGGYHAGAVERVELDVGGAARTVVVKRTHAVEVAAMRALAVVRGVDRPRLLAAGPDWIVSSHHPGPALAEGPDVPAGLWTTLARVHAHWLGKRPRGVPVCDAAWWRHLCVGRIRPHVVAAGERTGEPVFAEVADALARWAEDPAMHRALAVLPRTLVHGDLHRGNVLLAADGPTLIDWGNAKVAPPEFDLAVLRAQGAVDLAGYHAERARAAIRADGPDVSDGKSRPGRRNAATRAAGSADPRGVDAAGRACADAWAHVGYLGFAADHLGAERVAELADGAARALADLR